MRTVNVRALRNEIPHWRETLEPERELLPVSNGQPVARRLPPQPVAPRPRSPSLSAVRTARSPATMPAEQRLREDRDRRGT